MEKEFEDCRKMNSSLVRYYLNLYENQIFFCEALLLYENHLHCRIFKFVICEMENFLSSLLHFCLKKLSFYSWSLSSYVYYPVLLQF